MSKLPEGWAEASLGELASKIGSGATPRGGSNSYYATGIPLIRSQNIRFEGFDDEGLVFLNERQAAALESVTVRPDDVLLNITGASIGRVSLAPPRMSDARVNQHVSIIRTRSTALLPRYLAFYLRSPQVQARIHTEEYGVTRQALTKSWISGMRLPVPPLAEQSRIVEKIDALLSRLTEIHARTTHADKQIVASRVSFLGAMFEPHENWVSLTVGDVASAIRYGTAVKCDYDSTGIPVLRIPNIQSGTIDQTDLKYGRLREAEKHKLSLQAGDLLMIRSNGSVSLVGRTAVITEAEQGLAFAGYLIRIRLNRELVDPRFMHAVLQSRSMREIIENTARSTSGVNNINSEEIASLRLSLPPLDKQIRIARLIEQFDDRLVRIQHRIASVRRLLETLRQSILTRAFTGQLVPTEGEQARRQGRSYEPASALLERIRARGTSHDRSTGQLKHPLKGTARAPKGNAAMTKTRFDDDVHEKPYLAHLLRDLGGQADVEALFKRADLGVADFYKQLAWEADSGHIDATALDLKAADASR